jgi:ABC-type cobalamin/Fe3+-siderophores transport system ATPase subunit
MSRFAERFSLAQEEEVQQIRSSSSNRLSQDDKIIIFLGVTGSGKSSFIRAITNHNDVAVGHELCSGLFSYLSRPPSSNLLKTDCIVRQRPKQCGFFIQPSNP